ncbi:MAG: hypothetical protein H0T41_08175, partial [Rhodobacteraceae bacterium]|nr:hypothetical protein [Paracoccaceae bacterium]
VGETTARFRAVFGASEPVIGMVHLGALSARRSMTRGAGSRGWSRTGRDLDALQAAGSDAVMFGNRLWRAPSLLPGGHAAMAGWRRAAS